jgi:hypothetical protein
MNDWGASCDKGRTHEGWPDSDRVLHTNTLEIKAAFNGLRCFAADLRNCDVLLRIDNTTALAYINKCRSIQVLHFSAISRQIWR